MSETSGVVSFLYGTAPGRLLLKGILRTHADRIAVAFLRSSLSRPVVKPYAKRHNIPLSRTYRTYRDFFARTEVERPVDMEPSHLISPCDGWLSCYDIQADSSFSIKNSHYRLEDLLRDGDLAKRYQGGKCLIFRLCPSDFHHYCYIDDGYQGENHEIPGLLHSVQPICCENLPVYVLNRRAWTLLTTEHFGPVVQTEVGALVVGGIVNPRENQRVRRGEEKGHFELAGSTITLLFQKDRMELLPRIQKELSKGEVQVRQGMWIGNQVGK